MHTHTHTCMYTEIYHMYEYHHMKQGTLHVAEHEDISSHTQYMYSHTTPEKYSHTCMYKEIYHMCIYRHVQRERLQVAWHGEISAHSQRHTHTHIHIHIRVHTYTYAYISPYTHTHTRTYHTYTYAYISHIHIRVHITHTHTRTYAIHTYTYTYTYAYISLQRDVSYVYTAMCSEERCRSQDTDISAPIPNAETSSPTSPFCAVFVWVVVAQQDVRLEEWSAE